MTFGFSGTIWYWRGPAPWYFVSVPEAVAKDLKAMSPFVTYGWGMIPATVRIGDTEWQTALWPKDGGYIVPIKVGVQRSEGITEGDEVALTLSVGE